MNKIRVVLTDHVKNQAKEREVSIGLIKDMAQVCAKRAPLPMGFGLDKNTPYSFVRENGKDSIRISFVYEDRRKGINGDGDFIEEVIVVKTVTVGYMRMFPRNEVVRDRD